MLLCLATSNLVWNIFAKNNIIELQLLHILSIISFIVYTLSKWPVFLPLNDTFILYKRVTEQYRNPKPLNVYYSWTEATMRTMEI
jgi:hypothetical protein